MENKVALRVSIMTKMNFALQQNSVPLIRNIVLTNLTDKEISDAVLRVRFEPEFASAWDMNISSLLPGVAVEVSPVDINVHPDYLVSLTEKLCANAYIELFSSEGLLACESRAVEVLAYDQWTGDALMPESIAAFATPNHPAVREICSLASVYLKKWTGSPSFTGYQTQNPNNVKLQAAAVYAALQEANIAYTTPPAGFEAAQRVRLPDNVLSGKCGTCLDLSVLYCSCLESIGINPLLIFTSQHAFAGFRLENETFPECVVYDGSTITKRTAQGIDELCLVECTDFTAGKSVDFDSAFAHALEKMNDSSDFLYAIDIARCRASRICPLPLRICEDGKYRTADYGERKQSEITSAPDEIDMSLHVTAAEDREVTKQMIWERKLLDLTLRNSLLNFRPTSSSVQLMISDLASLEDGISNGDDFKILPAPEDYLPEITDSKIYKAKNGTDAQAQIAKAEFASRRLRSYMKSAELEKTLKKLHRSSKVSIEENGANTLYIALGFLRWYETEKSERPRYAPLVLIPIDLVRRVQDRSYSIRVRDEEVQMNITLLEMLRQNYGISINGLDPLPHDDSGINLPLVFSAVRKGVMAQSRWDIEEYAFIGQFSFSRFIMWNDIRNRAEDLKKNKVVASLIEGRMTWQAEDAQLSPRELDLQLSPSDMAIPTSVDSSQLAAVYSSAKGQSFVLHGPPGTGKSQTITNMIANALYNGKSVLFIAEKMAALSVVQKRLEKIGLAPFCLELHSNKAQKRAVLSQFENTLAIGRTKDPEEYERCADKLLALRNELNGVMESIHRKRSFGMSAYEAIVRYEQSRKYDSLLSFTPEQIDGMDENSYSDMRELMEKAAAAYTACGGYAGSPLKYCEDREYSIEKRDRLSHELEMFAKLLSKCEKDIAALKECFGEFTADFGNYCTAAQLAEKLSDAETVLTALIFDEVYITKKEALDKLANSGKEYTSLVNAVLAGYECAVLDIDPDAYLLRLRAARQKWALPEFFEKRRLLKELNLYAKQGNQLNENTLADFLDRLIKIKSLKNDIQSAPAQLTEMLGGMWLGISSDFEALSTALMTADGIRTTVNEMRLSVAETAALCTRLSQIIAQKSAFTEKISGVVVNAEHISAAAHCLKNEFRLNFSDLFTAPDWYVSVTAAIAAMQENIGGLKDHTAFICMLDTLSDNKLENAAQAFRAGTLTAENAVGAFDCATACAMAKYAIMSDSGLSAFSSAQLEDSIRRYKDVISQFEELTVKELVARLSAKIPTPGNAAASSEVGILQKAIKNGARLLPLRKLFDSIPNLLRRMCPCMLMSPISVAQYIDPASEKFDLVIFDEASQLPTCEAVGAIARGENVIVVGDPKQLPPTSFFSANSVDEENFEKEDLESVLDDCLALSMPQKHLLWHYRSRHESLIAYSNAKYYDNKLMTFPSPEDLVSQVSLVKVDGYYDKGATKQNKAEAQAVVAEIVRRLSDETLRKDSIGVVTFSLPQQVLIDDMLAEEYRKNPQLEQWANEMYEPLFIKNLENVQGDERDVILFSVGYGPDKEGRVSMNFGPLNRDGGWRRLNVAISRSRKQMTVYSVLTPDMIDLSRTASDGVAGLKGFLEFAAHGKNVLAVRHNAVRRGEGLECVIAEELKKAGYDAKCGVGCSEYRIDVGVIDPDNPDKYILAVMCDGEEHTLSSTARDRAVSQPGVLKGLGWNVMNVYSLDWFDNREKVMKSILSAIKAAKEKPTEAEPEKKSAPIVFEKEQTVSIKDKCEKYVPCNISGVGTAEEFTLPSSKEKIIGVIKRITAAEAPISRESLYEKTLAAFSVTRSTAAVKEAFSKALDESGVYCSDIGAGAFCWQTPQQSVDYGICRIPDDGGEKRSMDEIAPEEIANAVMLIITEQISMTKSDLVKETAKLFGFSRTGGVMEAAIEFAVHYCSVTKGCITIEAGKVTLK